ncbi:MAG: 4-(cytidine 5'-diphospho)-2-C-methyl-D-erythritol kinase [Clostridiales bacterium]|nr:4-(cytidine 5'-diphospho)-2-C-methyl-D-erythritol kinase [Clostridiales bacterium]
MKKLTVLTPAKLNLTLDVLGVNGNFHDIESLVVSINLFDKITVKARQDGKITLLTKGREVDCPVIENNAYKAAKLFVDTFGTTGVDIIVDKNIPVAGGLGGSSADIAGVLNALNALYGINGEIELLANDLGSDAAYMLHGGVAVMKGRGEIIETSDADRKIYLLLITEDTQIAARNCYKKFDQKKKLYPSVTQKAERILYTGDLEQLFPLLKNDLGEAAAELVPNIKHNIFNLKKAGAANALVAGSGPTVYGVFEEKAERDKAYKKLTALYGKSLIKAETVVKINNKFI